MGFLHERANDLATEQNRFSSAWQQLADEWRDERSQEFEREVIQPYRTYLNALEAVMREMADLFEEIGNIQ